RLGLHSFLLLRNRSGAVLLFSRLLGVRRQNQVQRVAFLPRPKFYDPIIRNVFNQALQNFAPQTGAGHFTPAEEDGRFDLVAFFQEAQHVVLLGLVVVLVHVDAEFNFFNGNGLLVFLGLALFLLLLVQEFPVIHDAADGRVRGGRNFNQIQVLF